MSQQFPTQPPPPPPPASGAPPPSPSGPATQSTGKTLGIVAVSVAAALGLAGGIYALTRSDTSDTISSPSVSTEAVIESTDVPPTDAPTTEVPATDPLATEVPATDPLPTDPPTTDPVGTIATDPADGLTAINLLLAWTSFSEEPLDEAAQQAEIDRLLIDRSVQAVAHPAQVSTMCAGIPVDASLDFTITWQFQGETVQSDERVGASPPGVGSCLSNGGEPLSAGAYQVFASDADENEVGYATTFVVGADIVLQRFVNNTDIDLCQIAVAPLTTAYYEFFVSDGGNIAPGEFVDFNVASVEQDLRAADCDGNDLEPLTFVPDGSSEQNLTP